jgi:hypothetical protein
VEPCRFDSCGEKRSPNQAKGLGFAGVPGRSNSSGFLPTCPKNNSQFLLTNCYPAGEERNTPTVLLSFGSNQSQDTSLCFGISIQVLREASAKLSPGSPYQLCPITVIEISADSKKLGSALFESGFRARTPVSETLWSPTSDESGIQIRKAHQTWLSLGSKGGRTGRGSDAL